MGPEFPAGQGAGVLAVADTKKRSARGSGDGADEGTLSLDTAIVAIDAEILPPAAGVDFGNRGVARSGAVAVIAKDVGVIGIGKFGEEKEFLSTNGSVDDQDVGLACFRIARNFVEVGLKLGAAAVGQNFGGGVTEVVGIIVFEGDFEGVDILFSDGVKALGQLEAEAQEPGQREDGNQGDDDQEFGQGEAKGRTTGHIDSIARSKFLQDQGSETGQIQKLVGAKVTLEQGGEISFWRVAAVGKVEHSDVPDFMTDAWSVVDKLVSYSLRDGQTPPFETAYAGGGKIFIFCGWENSGTSDWYEYTRFAMLLMPAE